MVTTCRLEKGEGQRPGWGSQGCQPPLPHSPGTCPTPYLQDGEILQHAVHHVLLWQVLQLVDKVDHVLTERGPVDTVQIVAVLVASVLCLQNPREEGGGMDNRGLASSLNLLPQAQFNRDVQKSDCQPPMGSRRQPRSKQSHPLRPQDTTARPLPLATDMTGGHLQEREMLGPESSGNEMGQVLRRRLWWGRVPAPVRWSCPMYEPWWWMPPAPELDGWWGDDDCIETGTSQNLIIFNTKRDKRRHTHAPTANRRTTLLRLRQLREWGSVEQVSKHSLAILRLGLQSKDPFPGPGWHLAV